MILLNHGRHYASSKKRERWDDRRAMDALFHGRDQIRGLTKGRQRLHLRENAGGFEDSGEMVRINRMHVGRYADRIRQGKLRQSFALLRC